MGKKAKMKLMRRMAQEMPAMEQNANEVKIYSGGELLAKGIKEVEGVKVEYGKRYKGVSVVRKPVDHYKEMKNAYNKHGRAGVISYVGAIKHLEQQQVNG